MNHEIRVDWPACKGRGLCFEVAPELLELDEWGYPVVMGVVSPELLSHAREAARTCPTLALRVVPVRSRGS